MATKTITEALRNMLVLYEQQIGDRVVARIVQLYQTESVLERRRSQYLALVLHDTQTDRWIALRLSTFRKVLAFVIKRGFDKARRLTETELRILQRKEAQRG